MAVWNQISDPKTLENWDASVQGLAGFNPYQGRYWGSSKSALGQNVLYFLAQNDAGQLVAAAQVIVRTFANKIAQAWIPGGPIGELEAFDESFRQTLLTACKAQYIQIRISIMRSRLPEDVCTMLQLGWDQSMVKINSGLSMKYEVPSGKDSLLETASSNWRHNLRRGLKRNLRVERWNTPSMDEILKVYRSMESFKGIETQYSESDMRSIFTSLGNNIILFRSLDDAGNVLALRACVTFGKSGWDFLAASSEEGRKQYSSHVLLNAIFNYCAEKSIVNYDMSGISPNAAGGVYKFKKGTGAKHIEFLGEWEWSSRWWLKLLFNLALLWRQRRS